MDIFQHAPWCPAQHLESHAVCSLVVGEVDLIGQRVIVSLHQARRTRPTITLILRGPNTECLAAMESAQAGKVADSLGQAVAMLG